MVRGLTLSEIGPLILSELQKCYSGARGRRPLVTIHRPQAMGSAGVLIACEMGGLPGVRSCLANPRLLGCVFANRRVKTCAASGPTAPAIPARGTAPGSRQTSLLKG